MLFRVLFAFTVLGSIFGLAPQASAANKTALTCAGLSVPSGKCTLVGGTLTITGANGGTLNGHGASLVQSSVPTTAAPMVELIGDKNLTITNLTLNGALKGSNGGVNKEGDFGIELQGDSGITLSNVTVENTLGDWVYLAPPYAIKGSTALNTGITFTQDTFVNAGYHGFTLESVGCPTTVSCNGLTISHSTMTSMAVDAIDAEYDLYPSVMSSNGVASFAAQDFITIEDNTWTNWSDDWYASVQSTNKAGVQQQRVTLSGNTLNADAPLFEVQGTPTYSTTPPFLNAYMTVTNNKFGSGYYAKGYRGGSSPAGEIHSVAGLIMEHNTFPLCQAAKYCGSNPRTFTPNQYMLDAYNINYSVIEHNDFDGALGVVEPQMFNLQSAHLLLCKNTYGVGDATLDAPACLY